MPKVIEAGRAAEDEKQLMVFDNLNESWSFHSSRLELAAAARRLQHEPHLYLRYWRRQIKGMNTDRFMKRSFIWVNIHFICVHL
jgi:hypothetical protein